MLLNSIDLLFNNHGAFLDVVIVFFAAVAPALLIAITVHEFSHASPGDSPGRPNR